MSKRIQLRRGTSAEINAFTGAVGEPTYNETYKTIVVHDGVTKGGIALAKVHEIPSLVPQATEAVVGKAKIATTAIAQAGTNDTDFITPKKMQAIVSNLLGGTPVNVLSSRAANVTYTNPSSIKYMVIYLTVHMVSGRIISFEINGISARSISSGGATWFDGGTFIVPPLGTYKLVGDTSAVTGWSEA